VSIIVSTIFNEAEKHFLKPNTKYYSCLHRTVLGGGYIILHRHEWEAQPDDLAKKSLILTRLNTLERLIK